MFTKTSALAFLLFSALSPQTSQATVSIRGRVIDAVTTRPVSGISVSLVTPRGSLKEPIATSGDAGAFVFDKLPPGEYSLLASGKDYIATSYGQTDYASPFEWLRVLPGTTRDDVVIRIWPHPFVAGTVKTELGQRLGRSTVHALRERLVGGERRLVSVRTARTNGDGAYEFTTLLPGRYVFALRGMSSPIGDVVFPTQYYSLSDAPSGALQIDLRPGDRRIGVDFIQQSVPGFTVEGQLVIDRPLTQQMELQLKVIDVAVRTDFDSMTVQTDPDGNFSFKKVRPGRYELQGVSYPTWPSTETGARFPNSMFNPSELPLAETPTGPTTWVKTEVTVVDADIRSLRVPARDGFSVSGRVMFDGTRQAPDSAQFVTRPVYVRPLLGGFAGTFPQTRLNSDGTFKTVPLPPGRYVSGMLITFPGWAVHSIMVEGSDVAGRSFDLSHDVRDVLITLTDRVSGVSGAVTVQTPLGASPPPANVVAFPSVEAMWADFGTGLPGRFVQVRRQPTGQYELNLMPGDYFVAAIKGALPDDWQDPTYLRKLRAFATAVSVTSGKTVNLNLAARDIK